MSIFSNLDGTFRDRFSIGKPRNGVYLDRDGSGNLSLRDLVVTTAQKLVDLISRTRTSQLAGLTAATVGVAADLLMLELATGGALRKIQLSDLFYYQLAESRGESSTDDDVNWQTKVTITTPANTGSYLLYWSTMYNNSDKKGNLRLYNTTDTAILGDEHPFRVKDGGDKYPQCSGLHKITLTGTAKTYAIQWISIDGNTQYLKDSFILLLRVY